MDPEVERITLLLTGELPFIVYSALLMTIPFSWVLLKLYRRAVIRTMEKQSSSLEAPQPLTAPTTVSPPETELTISILDPSQMPKPDSLSAYQKLLLMAPTKAVLVYLVAGLGYAAFMTWGFLASDQIPFAPIRTSITITLFGWPVVLTAQLITGTTLQRWLKPLLIYWSIYSILTLLATTNNPNAKFSDMLVLWGVTNLPTTLVWWIVLNRHLRAVSPLVLIILLLAVAGSLLMFELFVNNQFVMGLTIFLLRPLGFGARGFLLANILFGLLAFCGIGWLLLNLIRWQYQRKKLSEQVITLDALWLLFIFIAGISIVFEGLVWIIILPVAFLIYKGLTMLGFRWLIRQNIIPNHPCLLLLRVFSLGRRSEQMFDAVSTHWRYLGKIRLIAGPDLATTTIEPHEFMDYVSRNLGHNFIDSEEKLKTALKECKNYPDRDGRFRVEEFFCYGNTWKMVLARLANTCDVVMMDLRGFSPQNAGCIFEINTLIHQLPLDRVIFTTDATTDLPFLENTIKHAWEHLPEDSPNKSSTNPKLTLFKYQSGKNMVQDRLLESLCEAAVPMT